MQDLVAIDSKDLRVKLLVVAVLLVAIVFCWLSIRWQFGNMLADLTKSTDPQLGNIADLAISWSPDDPAVNLLKASAGDSIEMYEQTVRLAPNDYRWRMALGRALEQDEQVDRAEIQMKKGVELAPSYASARWQLGNFFLRQNRIDEALSEFRRAAENNLLYRDQVFSLVWEYFDKDPAQVEMLAGERPDARVRLAYFFAARGQANDSLRNWNMLSDEDKAANPEIAKALAHGLYLKRYFPQSLEFARQLGIDADAQAETITNSSFEQGLGESADSRFGWQIVRTDSKLEITTDAKVRREGNRSARTTFRNYAKPELYNLFQTVVVQPNTRYRISFWVRTENLKSGGAPVLDVANANEDRLIVRSQPFPGGTNDWRQLSVEFTTPPGCNGISIRTSREPCGVECPITGTFWYDDFELDRL